MLTLSLSVVGMAFVPRLVLGVASSDRSGWMVSSAVGFIWSPSRSPITSVRAS
jgi:hypothetical protein